MKKYKHNNYKIPKRKKWLLTDSFLLTFKEELDRIFKVYDNYDNPTYWNTYAWLDSTGGFYSALKIASDKHNVTKAIYEYAHRMPWYDSDLFDGELTLLMVSKGIIEEGNIDEANFSYTDEELETMLANGEIEWYEEVKQKKGYKVIKRDWRFSEDNSK